MFAAAPSSGQTEKLRNVRGAGASARAHANVNTIHTLETVGDERLFAFCPVENIPCANLSVLICFRRRGLGASRSVCVCVFSSIQSQPNMNEVQTLAVIVRIECTDLRRKQNVSISILMSIH